MFPNQITSPVTIWVPWTNKETGEQTAVRCVLNGCFWNDDSIAVTKKTGIQVVDTANIFVPHNADVTGLEYLNPKDWDNLNFEDIDKYWTVDPRQLPLIAKYEHAHAFDWAVPNSPNRLTVQESSFMLANSEIRRVTDVNRNLFGSKNMWYIQIKT